MQVPMECVNEVAKDGRSGRLHWRIPDGGPVVPPDKPVPKKEDLSQAQRNNLCAVEANESSCVWKEKLPQVIIDDCVTRLITNFTKTQKFIFSPYTFFRDNILTFSKALIYTIGLRNVV